MEPDHEYGAPARDVQHSNGQAEKDGRNKQDTGSHPESHAIERTDTPTSDGEAKAKKAFKSRSLNSLFRSSASPPTSNATLQPKVASLDKMLLGA